MEALTVEDSGWTDENVKDQLESSAAFKMPLIAAALIACALCICSLFGGKTW